MKDARLALSKVKKSFFHKQEATQVVRGVEAEFFQGTTYAITGVSGTGKSTVLHLLSGIERPSEGQVLYNDRDIATFSTYERDDFFNTCIGLVFQSPHLLREFSVIENLVFPGRIKGTNASACNKQAYLLLKAVGLSGYENAMPGVLSGGQQQRLALARALFNKPNFLLADEPTGGLDVATGEEIVNLLLQLQDEWKMGSIICTHDMRLAEKMNVIYRMHEGRLVKEKG